MQSPAQHSNSPVTSAFSASMVAGEAVPALKAVRVPAVSQIRQMLDELEHRIDDRFCVESDGEDGSEATLEQDLNELLQAVQELIASCHHSQCEPVDERSSVDQSAETQSRQTKAGPQSVVRIQLKLSPDLVRVLQTVRQHRVKASELVETVLWNSPRVRDTARLAGIRRPRRRKSA